MTLSTSNILLLVCILGSSWCLNAKTIYLDSETGNDSNQGLTPELPIRTLSRLEQIQLYPGDSILLRAGQEFSGAVIVKNFTGQRDKPLVISSYPENDGKAIINGAGRFAAILLENSSSVRVENVELIADGGGMKEKPNTRSPMRCGILVLGS